ncbi:MAG: TIR domain-containing protein [Peptococcaceae bacterium]|nr:TIR domain-containing protein [Peptococcaceae bacterium]
MPDLKTYDLFISHAWRYDDDYYRLEKFLKDAPLFKWRNYSVPKHDPALDPNKPTDRNKLLEALRQQIRPVNCVIILSGMYVAYSDWIQSEINIAQEYKKPIIGVRPWGQERIPTAVSSVAKTVVGWNTSSIISAIRTYSL